MPKRAFLLTAGLLWTCLAGCPTLATPESDRLAPQSLDPTSAFGSSASDAGDFGNVGGAFDTQSFADLLRDQFPACAEPFNAAAWRNEILRLVNVERNSRGLPGVRRNTTLEAQATNYACELIQYDYFDHVNPVTGSTLSDRTDELGYDFLVVGENLAAGQTTPQQAFNDWMQSEGHRDNILDERFTELGVAARTGGRFNFYWIQVFGRPVSAGP